MKHLLTALLILLSTQFARAQAQVDLHDRLDAYMNRLTKLGYSGALLVAQDGAVVFSEGYGLADRSKQIPVTPETIFTTGSITKQFTAAAIMKLEMLGKLNVRDVIDKYFPHVPEDKQAITLHHLLTHSAGFRPALGHDFNAISRDEYIKLAMQTSLNRQPGEAYEYSNTGFSLLAAIVEQVSGMSYDAFLQEHLFKPAGMTETGYPMPDWDRSRMARGYRGEQDWGTFLDHDMADDGPYWHLRGNGGVHTTIGDMYKWHLALAGNEILSDAAKAKMFASYIKEGRSQSYYGYGWSIQETPHGKLITHNGGNPYFEADFYRFVDADVVIFVTSNAAEQGATRISRNIVRIVFGEEVPLPPLEVQTISTGDLSKSERGRHALGFLELLGTKDDEKARELLTRHYSSGRLEKESVDKNLQLLQPDRDEIGATRLGQVNKADENTFELMVQSLATGQWWRIKLMFEEAPPHQIAGIGVVDTDPPTTASAQMEGSNDWGLPDSPTGRRAAAFLNAVKRADHEHTKSFIQSEFAEEFKNAFSMDDHLAMFNKMYTTLGELELEGAMKTGPFSAELTVRAKKTNHRFQVLIELAPKAPHLISGLSVEAKEQMN